MNLILDLYRTVETDLQAGVNHRYEVNLEPRMTAMAQTSQFIGFAVFFAIISSINYLLPILNLS